MPVYFIQVGRDGPVKIGFSRNLKMRFNHLQNAHVETLRILREVEGGRVTEKHFHELFAGQHIVREWFRFSPEMLTAEPPGDYASTRPRKPNPKFPRPPAGGLAAAIRGLDTHGARGTQTELAERLGLSRAAISLWKGVVPIERLIEVERATGVSRRLLRPDLFPPLPGSPATLKIGDAA